MLDITYSKKYKKDVKRMIKRGVDMSLHDSLVSMLCEEVQIPPKHRDHELRGQWKGFRELHISPDWMLIYFLADNSVLLTGTGSHSDLYGL